MVLYIVLVLALFLSLGFFSYISFQKYKQNFEKQLLNFQNQEKKLNEKLKKEELAQKSLKEKLDLLSKKSKKINLKKVSEKVSLPVKNILEETLKNENNKLNRDLDHLEEQVKALISQITLKDKENKELELNLKKETQLGKKSHETALLKLREEQGKLKEKAYDQRKKNNKLLLELKLENKNFEKKAEVEFRKIKRKLKHYQQFYALSLNHKSMLEDKIKNWEKALSILASWVLKKENSQENMGELVSEALDKVGYGSLIKDEFDFKKDIPVLPKKTMMNPKKEMKQENHV